MQWLPQQQSSPGPARSGQRHVCAVASMAPFASRHTWEHDPILPGSLNGCEASAISSVVGLGGQHICLEASVSMGNGVGMLSEPVSMDLAEHARTPGWALLLREQRIYLRAGVSPLAGVSGLQVQALLAQAPPAGSPFLSKAVDLSTLTFQALWSTWKGAGN